MAGLVRFINNYLVQDIRYVRCSHWRYDVQELDVLDVLYSIVFLCIILQQLFRYLDNAYARCDGFIWEVDFINKAFLIETDTVSCTKRCCLSLRNNI